MMVPKWLCFVSLWSVAATASGTTVNAGSIPSDKNDGSLNFSDDISKSAGVDHGQRQIEWVRSKGGFVNEKMGIRKLEPQNPKSVYEVYSKEDIAKEELILVVPRVCLISSYPEEKTGDPLECGTARNMFRELQLGNASRYEPYITYLKETQEHGQLPSMWTDGGKQLLWSIVGGENENDQLLPPADPTGWIDYEWKVLCEGGDNPEEQHAALLVVQRSWDDLMIPIYDMMSHRNGHYLNTESNSVHGDDEDVYVRASRDIKAGEAIYTSYNECLDCSNRKLTYGTPEILRDYGFVEMYPRKFIFHDQQVGFALHEIEGQENLQLEWITEVADQSDLEFFVDEMERLEALGTTTFASKPDDIPDREWQVANQYREALVEAMSRLVQVVDEGEESTCNFEEGTCASSRYNPLNELTPELQFNLEACDRSVTLDFSNFEELEVIQSHYQNIVFEKDPENNDVCFDLDKILQICGDYRPHYHEMVVHYTARFLDKIQRVLWVGGGDSMLLHEILKYPSLEMVYGLELDQKVTRYSFKHFGTQPHWDNDKVQWWYGDAAKSMLMLPKELYGTFDLVLVDLSETVMSMSVTKGLDILAALSLLLKPDGIFVKNEMYLDKMSDLFKHTLQVHYYDVPRLCSQCLCLGSNKIDFLQQNLTEHNVDTLLEPLKLIDEDHYKVYNDFVRNPFSQRHCASDDVDDAPEEQESSPGIVMILEAEDAALELKPSNVKKAIQQAAENEGLTIVSTMTSSDDSRTVVVLQEGYIIARTLSEQNYCAFDIHLWSSFGKLEGIKTSLLAAVMSEGHSSFRIVASGMFGIKNWKEDEQSRGPKFTQECDEVPLVVGEVPMDEKLVEAIVEETMELLPWEDINAVVLCGSEDKACKTAETIAKSEDISKVIRLEACPLIEGDIQYVEDSEERTKACENYLLSKLENLLSGDKISLVVLDPSAPFALAQIFDHISNRSSKKRLFAENLMAIAPVLNLDETWRKVFLDRFRINFFKKSSYRSKVLFNSTDSTMEMGTFLSGDKTFFLQLDAINKAIEKRTDLISDIRAIHQGAPDYQADFEPTQYFLPEDYDQKAPLEQWESQHLWGLQTVFQLNINGELSKDETRKLLEGVLASMGITTSKKIQEFSSLGDGTVLFATWTEGDLIVLFDGRKHVTLNLFTIEEDVAFASELAKQFSIKNPLLAVGLRDEMPRGYGRVVNFLADVEPREVPHWAWHLRHLIMGQE